MAAEEVEDGRTDEQAERDEDERGAPQLAEALLERGAVVPISRAKRPVGERTGSTKVKPPPASRVRADGRPANSAETTSRSAARRRPGRRP